MTFVIVQFDWKKDGPYKKLLTALENSILKNCPDTRLEVIQIDTPPFVRAKIGFTSNTIKLKEWVLAIDRIKDTEIVFLDCDLIVRNDIKDIWKKDFDICYTRRTSKDTKIPLNAGVIFMRNNERGKRFMRLWIEINNQMYNDYSFHKKYRRKYVGMNQAALGHILENPQLHDAKVISVDCKDWNCCDEDWLENGSAANIIHIKGRLRDSCLDKVHTIPVLAPMVREWKEFANA